MFEENEVSIKSKGGTEMVKRGLAERLPEGLADDFQVICSRIRKIEEDKIRVYWLHDLPEDPETNHLKDKSSRDRFHKLVFCGHWQYNQYITKLGIPQDDKCVVIETPIDPIPLIPKSKEEVRLIYTSTPQRGLELLYPVFEKLCEKYDNIHLDVFSSFAIYGWDEADEKFEPLYEKFRNHPNMTYHGFADQQVLREHLLNAHILAYPNIWKETSCRVLMESMSAGLMCVHPNLGALPDTSGGLTSMYQFNDDVNKHANVFYNFLDHAIQIVNKPEAQRYLRFVKGYADSRFNIGKISSQWEGMLQDLAEQYPTVESRKIPNKMFVYKTS